ncbi:dethiobiotin synthase [Pendulispora brunnea]|uniref:ATP-dependent dethiobiotin synthetase BioD n=1 Tax=Pendulispora brunnea TaxID=2905690 RepID=A0ABZ2KA64_9BACT
MRRIVITGTGTGIGKTHFACAVARAAAAQKLRVAAFKPVETGGDSAGGEYTDSAQLAAVSSFHVKRWLDPVYTFREPISPHLAARRAGISLELQPILDAIRLFDDLDLHLVLLELAGGLFSPLNRKESNADLALALHQAGVASAAAIPITQQIAVAAESTGSVAPAVVTPPPATEIPGSTSGTWSSSGVSPSDPAFPSAAWSRADSFPPEHTASSPPTQDDSIPRVVLVAPDRLGALHEIAATTRAADAMGLPIAGVVLAMPERPDSSTGLNGAEIQYVTTAPYLGTLRRATIDTLASDLKISGFFNRLFG